MNIVVPMKQIPDLKQVRIKDRKPVLEDVPQTYGDLDKNALEAAVELQESAQGTIYALSVGSEELEDTVKEALAAGADEAVLVIDDSCANMESAQIAAIIADKIATLPEVGLVIFGEGSGDNYSGQMASRVAQLMHLPLLPYAKSIEINGETITAVCGFEDNDEILTASAPAIVSVVSDINTPRIPAVMQILKAGKKPKEVLDLDTDIPGAAVETLDSLAPESNRKQIEVKGAAGLIEALRSENLL